MADLANIGFRADTKELADAKVKLDALVPAAGRSERAAIALEKATGSLANAALKAARADVEKANAALRAARASDTATKSDIAAAAATKRQAAAAYDAAKAVSASTSADTAAAAAKRKLAAATDAAASAQQRQNSFVQDTPNRAAMNDNVPEKINQSIGAMRANVGNIAAQFQDVGVTAAMGMNPLLIAMQQGTQLSAVFAGMRPAEAVAALGTAFTSLISPVAIATIGIVALVAGLIQFVDWVSLAQWGLNTLATVIQTVAPYAAAAGAALAIAFAPQIAVAIWGISTAIVTGLIGAISALSMGLVALIGAVPLLIGAAIAAVFVFSDTIKQVFGIDVIDLTKRAVNLIIGSFVGAYHDIKFVWANFADIIGAAAIGAANFAISAVNKIVAASVSGINMLIRATNSVSSLTGFNPIGEISVDGAMFETMANDAADRLSNAVKGRNSQLKKDLETDYIGAIGGAITSATKAAADKLRSFSAGLGGVGDTEGGGKPKGPKTVSDAEKFADIISGAERTIATLQAQRDAIGQTAEETARLKYETQLLNEAQQKNINLTPEQKSKLLELAATMSTLEVETAKAKDALEFNKSTFKGFINDIAQGLESGKSFWEAFADAGLNALDKLVDKMLNEVIDAIFQVMDAGSGSGGGGFLGGLFDGIGGFIAGLFGVPTFAKGDTFAGGIEGHSNSIVNTPTMFAFASGAGIMGEAGPEAIMPLTRMPNGDLGVQASNSNSAPVTASNAPVQVRISIDLTGAKGNQEIEEIASKAVVSGLETFSNVVMPGRVLQITSDTRVR